MENRKYPWVAFGNDNMSNLGTVDFMLMPLPPSGAFFDKHNPEFRKFFWTSATIRLLKEGFHTLNDVFQINQSQSEPVGSYGKSRKF